MEINTSFKKMKTNGETEEGIISTEQIIGRKEHIQICWNYYKQ